MKIAAIVARLEGARSVYGELSALLAPLQNGGLVAAEGESAELSRMRLQLDEAYELLRTFANQQTLDEPLARLEQLLEGPEWDELAAQMRVDLQAKAAKQEEILRSYEARLGEHRPKLKALTDALAEARKVRAPAREASELAQRLEALEMQIRRATAERQFHQVVESVEKLETEVARIATTLPKMQERIDASSRYYRQADVLLLRAPSDALGRHHYSVILRTPAEPGAHGVNVQGSTTLADHDRRQMLMSLHDVDRVVRRRGTSAAAPATAGQPSSQAAAAIAGQPSPAAGVPVALPASPRTRDVEAAEGNSGVASALVDLAEQARDVGDIMYRLLMPEQLHQYLADVPCSLTITTNDLELPWELMYYDDNFLCLERPIGRMPMGESLPRRSRATVAVRPKLRFLLICSDPRGDLPAAKAEVNAVAAALQKSWGSLIDLDVLISPDASSRRLNDALRRGSYDLIHYAGHATFDRASPELSGLIMDDEVVFFAQKIRRLLEGRPLVFLNACESASIKNEDVDPQRTLRAPAEGLAAAFIYGGALGCLGSSWPIYDDSAAEFALDFYSNVLEGYMIGEALRVARKNSRRKHPDQLTWASFVLYGNPTFRLVE